jgi:hypothetical protein
VRYGAWEEEAAMVGFREVRDDISARLLPELKTNEPGQSALQN